MATPVFQSATPPLRVDIYLPPKHLWSPALCSSLDAAKSYHMRDARCTSLGINQLLASRLSAWSSQINRFEEFYRNLSFGSWIYLNQLNFSDRNTHFEVVHNHLEGFLGLDELMARWGLPDHKTPKAISVRHLVFHVHITATIAVIKWTEHSAELLAMKSATYNPGVLYHELKTLLTLPEHRHIVGCLRYLVTDVDPSLPSAKVVGFLQEYFPLGSLDRILGNRILAPSIELQTRIRWARQIISTLIHLRNGCNYFYSDLKPENIVVRGTANDLQDLVLIDFEQNGTTNSWSAPEVYHVETLVLASRVVKNPVKRQYYRKLLKRLTGMDGNISCKTYCNPPHGHLAAWVSLSHAEKENAQVFALGKVLFCIFESVGTVTNQISDSSLEHSFPEFPHFVNTPTALQSLILKCTQGARELDTCGPKLFRIGDKLVGYCKDREYDSELEETLAASRTYFINRIKQMEDYAEAQIRIREKDGSLFWSRPTLQQVLDALEAFDNSTSLDQNWRGDLFA